MATTKVFETFNCVDDFDDDDDYDEEEAPPAKKEGAAGEEGADLINYKGIYFNDEPGQKFTDPDTGAHF